MTTPLTLSIIGISPQMNGFDDGTQQSLYANSISPPMNGFGDVT